MKKFFHISSLKNRDSIIKNGLKANNGMVFLFEKGTVRKIESFVEGGKMKLYLSDIPVEVCIARGQLFFEEYSLFSVELTKEEIKALEKDNVAELSANFQWIYNKDIPADRVKHIRDQKVSNIRYARQFLIEQEIKLN